VDSVLLYLSPSQGGRQFLRKRFAGLSSNSRVPLAMLQVGKQEKSGNIRKTIYLLTT
jgi:hypothetical protein